MTPECAATLEGVPLLLESTDPRVTERIYPETCVAEEDERQWRDHAVPELERLFASRCQLVRRDLAAMKKVDPAGSHVLVIPDVHVNAWLAALNAARLALYALNDLTAEWMAGKETGSASAKQLEALARIHLLAEVQAVLLGEYELEVSDPDECDDFDAADFDELEDEDDEDGDDDDAGDAPEKDAPKRR
ncbi:MAG: hypothetical protein H6838_17820 [Planctomycetes bacterium]|nr:hypothetical protein [Planctomycetota bacterium]